jgi:hypothetical protein
MIAGAVLAPVGWVMFAKNRRPHIEMTPPSGAASGGSTTTARTPDYALRVGVAPSTHGGSFAAALTF